MKLSAHFDDLEFWGKSPTAIRLDINNKPTPEILINLGRLAQTLELVRDIYHQPLEILSGYRCPELNKAVGGAANSYHQLGLAADIHPPAGITFQEFKGDIIHNMISFDLMLEEQAKDGGHWLHFQINKPGTLPRNIMRVAELDHVGGAITRITVG